MKLIAFEEFKALMPNLSQELIGQKFPEDTYVVLLTLSMDDEQENGIVLLKYDEGLWRVMGIGD